MVISNAIPLPMAIVVTSSSSAEIAPITTLPPPLVSSYNDNDRIRPLLDAVDKLRSLKVMKEGIQLPTIVVVGDQSSGKSSVLESLAAINLPRGQGICTRVPLIMRLQNHPDQNPSLSLEYMGRVVPTDEEHVSEAIELATQEIAGDEKGISNTPITLVVKKNGVPDLTMVDLPGITRVPVRGQPDNIYEQIREMIMEYITPEESIILNVLSATVDFTTCESIMLSQSVDKTGQRTLAVVTKSDKAPEGLLEKVTNDDVNIGLGYVCVRNRIGQESYNEARIEESTLFRCHPFLSKIEKSMVGIPVLAKKLVLNQFNIVSKCIPNIIKQINSKLNTNLIELEKMPKKFTSIADAMTALMELVRKASQSLNKILIRGEYDEYPDEMFMHSVARITEMLNGFSDELVSMDDYSSSEFLMEEVHVLEECKAIGLPNFVPRSSFLYLLKKQINQISPLPVNFVNSLWGYVEKVLVFELKKHCENYPQLISSISRAADNLISRMKEDSMSYVRDVIEMEKLTDYTCNPEYMSTWNKLMSCQEEFMKIIEDDTLASQMNIEGYGNVDIGHLRKHKNVALQALDIKMRMNSYWKIVRVRMVDSLALHLMFKIENLVNKELVSEIVKVLMSPCGGGMERMLEESPSVATKRQRLVASVSLLKESKDVVSRIMD